MMKNTDIAWLIPQSQWPFMCLIWKHLKSGPFYSRISMLLFFYRVCTTRWIQILISTVNHIIKFLPDKGFKFGINGSCECGKKFIMKKRNMTMFGKYIHSLLNQVYMHKSQACVTFSIPLFNPLWQRKD